MESATSAEANITATPDGSPAETPPEEVHDIPGGHETSADDHTPVAPAEVQSPAATEATTPATTPPGVAPPGNAPATPKADAQVVPTDANTPAEDETPVPLHLITTTNVPTATEDSTEVRSPPTKCPVEVDTRTSPPLQAEIPEESPTGEVLTGAKPPATTEDPTRAGGPTPKVKYPATTVEVNNTATPGGDDQPREVPVTTTPDTHADTGGLQEAEDKLPTVATPATHAGETTVIVPPRETPTNPEANNQATSTEATTPAEDKAPVPGEAPHGPAKDESPAEPRGTPSTLMPSHLLANQYSPL